MCIQTRIQRILAEKEALDAQLQKLDQLETKTAPVKDLLSELLADYSDVAPEDLVGVWGEVLSIGQKFGLSVQPLAADELRQWKATNTENQELHSKCKKLEEDRDELLVRVSQAQTQYLKIREKEVVPLEALIDSYQSSLTSAEIELASAKKEAALSVNQKHVQEIINQLQKERDSLEAQLAEMRSQLESSLEAHTQNLLPDLHDEKTEEELAVDDDEKDIPALTLWQPWATLIAEEIKCIETRSWATSYRGPLAIHAAKRPIYTGSPELLDLLQKGSEPPLGAVVAIANLIDCIEMTPQFIAQQSEQELKCGDWQPGRFAWVLEIIRPIVPPIPATGGQKLWNWSGTSVTAELEYLAKLNSKPEPEYESKEATDTVESILGSHGFFMPDINLGDCYDQEEKYEDYQGWAVYYSQLDQEGPVDGIGLHCETFGFWDASTEMIGEDDPTFPEHFTDYDAIVAWTRQVIDKVVAATPVESSEAPGQLALEFPKPTPVQSEEVLTGEEYDAAVEEELGDNDETILITFQGQQWLVEVLNESASGISILIQTKNRNEGFTATVTRKDVENNDCSLAKCAEQVLNERLAARKQPEPTELQKLLPENDYYHVCFEPKEIGGRYRVFVNIHSIIEEGVEKAKIETGWLEGNSEKRTHCIHAQTFVCQYNDNTYQQDIRKMALTYAKRFLREAASKSTTPEAERYRNFNQVFELQKFKVEVRQHDKADEFAGASFNFYQDDELIHSTSLTAVDCGNKHPKELATEVIENYWQRLRDKAEKEANPYKKPEDDFIELVKLTPAVGYIKRRDNGELLSAYVAFANRDAAGEKTATLAKPRAKKWAEHLHASFESCGWKVEEPRKVKRMQSEPGAKQQSAYEIKITGKFSIEQLQLLAQENFSLLPGELTVTPKKSPASAPQTSTSENYRVMVNGYEVANGTEEEMRSRFDTELKTFGEEGRITMCLMSGQEIVEGHNTALFKFTEVENFNPALPSYKVLHRPTQKSFDVWLRSQPPNGWANIMAPYQGGCTTKEAAAVDAVRRSLKAEKAK